jgi:hypothetical protein
MLGQIRAGLVIWLIAKVLLSLFTQDAFLRLDEENDMLYDLRSLSISAAVKGFLPVRSVSIQR